MVSNTTVIIMYYIDPCKFMTTTEPKGRLPYLSLITLPSFLACPTFQILRITVVDATGRLQYPDPP